MCIWSFKLWVHVHHHSTLDFYRFFISCLTYRLGHKLCASCVWLILLNSVLKIYLHCWKWQKPQFSKYSMLLHYMYLLHSPHTVFMIRHIRSILYLGYYEKSLYKCGHADNLHTVVSIQFRNTQKQLVRWEKGRYGKEIIVQWVECSS